MEGMIAYEIYNKEIFVQFSVLQAIVSIIFDFHFDINWHQLNVALKFNSYDTAHFFVVLVINLIVLNVFSIQTFLYL